MTYLNIWSNFCKWIIKQTNEIESNINNISKPFSIISNNKKNHNPFLINIHPFGFIALIEEKSNTGISFKINDNLLNEFNLSWDLTRFNCEEYIKSLSNYNTKNIITFNIISISANLNVPKIYIQNGLENIFKACMSILEENNVCIIDLEILGKLYCKHKIVFHIPNKLLNSNENFDKKISIKNLIERPLQLNKNFDFYDTYNNIKSNDKNINSSNNLAYKINKISSKNNIKLPSIADKCLNTNFKKAVDSIIIPYDLKNKCYINNKYYSIETNLNNIYSSSHKKDKSNSAQFKKSKKNVSKLLIPIPSLDKNWDLMQMLKCSFVKNTISKNKINPILFNVYSNTKAAPFTGEKTQIPISHRIGSFYSLPLQSFIIDKTTNSVKRLYDEYFKRNYLNTYNTTCLPATEEEEYKAYVKNDSNNPKVLKRKEAYETYQNLIKNSVDSNYISDIKEIWLINIIKNCMRVYNFNSNRQNYMYNSINNNFDNLLKVCFEQIMGNYQYSIKKSIIDYMLKHPEQREKLNISLPFRKLKEYAEAKVARPSENSISWKTNWNISKIKISANLMIIGDNITSILNYFTLKIKNSSYFIIPKPFTTMNLSPFIDMQNNKIEEQKRIIGEEWKKFVEHTLKQNKLYKDQLILYFKSVSGVMSSQLRKVIINSICNFYKFILSFKKIFKPESKELTNMLFSIDNVDKYTNVEQQKNLSSKKQLTKLKSKATSVANIQSNSNLINIKKSLSCDLSDNIFYKNAYEVFFHQFDSKFNFENSFLEISISYTKNTPEFKFSDNLEGIKKKLNNLVYEVIRCSKGVERPDNMFIKNLEKQSNLWEVPINDTYVTKIMNDIDETITDNIELVSKVLNLYEDFKFVNLEKMELEDEVYQYTNKFNNNNNEELKSNQIISTNIADSLIENYIENDNNIKSKIVNFSESNNKSRPNVNFSSKVKKQQSKNINSLNKLNSNFNNSVTKYPVLSIDYIRNKIRLYENKICILEQFYPNCLYMNMIKINCLDVNTYLIKELNECIDFLLNFIYKEKLVCESKNIVEDVEKLKDKLNKPIDSLEKLHDIEIEIEEINNDKIPDLNQRYGIFLEWVFFYYEFDTFSIIPSNNQIAVNTMHNSTKHTNSDANYDNNNNNQTNNNDINNSLNKLIEECYSSISKIPIAVSNFVNNSLKEKRLAFESILNKNRIDLDNLMKEVFEGWEQLKESVLSNLGETGHCIKYIDSFNLLIERTLDSLNKVQHDERLLNSSILTESEKILEVKSGFDTLNHFFKQYDRIIILIDKKIQNEYIKKLSIKKLKEEADLSESLIKDANSKLTYLMPNLRKHNLKRLKTFINVFEIIKYIHNLVELIFTYEDSEEGEIDSWITQLLVENEEYCQELCNVLYDKENNDINNLKNLSIKSITADIENFNKHKNQIERISSEWEIIKNIGIARNIINNSFEIKLEFGNYNNTLYKLITDQSFDNITRIITENINNLQKNLSGVGNLNKKSSILDGMNNFKENINQLLKIIQNIETCQKHLEGCMGITQNYSNPQYYDNIRHVSFVLNIIL